MDPTVRTKAEILDAASRLFHRYGYVKTSIADIVRAAHKAKGSLYYHFSGKEELFCAVVEREIDRLKAGLIPVFEDAEAGIMEQLERYVFVRMDLMNRAYAYQELLKNEFQELGIARERILVLKEEFVRWEKGNLVRLLEAGREKGLFDPGSDPDKLADILEMLFRGLEALFFLENRYESYRENFRWMVQFFCRGLVLKPEPAGENDTNL